MEFKIGDKVKLIKSSSYYQTQGIDSDGYCMDGEIFYDCRFLPYGFLKKIFF